MEEKLSRIRIAAEELAALLREFEDLASRVNILAALASVEAARNGAGGAAGEDLAAELVDLAALCTGFSRRAARIGAVLPDLSGKETAGPRERTGAGVFREPPDLSPGP